MAKSPKRKISTNEALEQLLGRKAAKRLRKIAKQLAADQNPSDERKKGKKKKTTKKNRR